MHSLKLWNLGLDLISIISSGSILGLQSLPKRQILLGPFIDHSLLTIRKEGPAVLYCRAFLFLVCAGLLKQVC